MSGWAGKTAERARFTELIRQGSEACRTVGVNRKTGTRWLDGRHVIDSATGTQRSYAPVLVIDAVLVLVTSSRFLSEDERLVIAGLRRAGAGVRAIVRELGRAPSTISRELRRNTTAASGVYRPFHAHNLARKRRARPRASKLAANPLLCEQVRSLMRLRWSPAQIARHLRVSHPHDRSMRVVHETIYRDLYDWRGVPCARSTPAAADQAQQP